MNVDALKLMLISKPAMALSDDYLSLLKELVIGGVTAVQIRDKEASHADLKSYIQKIQQTLLPFHIPILINDHVDLAKETNAAGVHLGQNDLSPKIAREILGPSAIIGYSVETIADLETANSMDEIDYIGASAVFPSSTKEDCKTYWGLQGLEMLIKHSKHPVIAIGGITFSKLKAIKEHGAEFLAISSALHEASHPRKMAQAFREAFLEGKA